MEKSEQDLKVQVPSQAWITSFAVMDIDEALGKNPNISLKEYIDGQKAKTNIWAENPNFSIYNLGSLFMMAYAFLVVPKESIEKYQFDMASDKIDILKKIEIRVNNKQNGLSESENTIRHIRNSIAHASFDIIPDKGSIIFIDKFHGNITFDGEMGIDDFKSLIVEYYKMYYQNFHNEFIANSNQLL
jgi:hypothetical protein